MHKRNFAELQSIANNRELTKECDAEFFRVLECGLVMALKELGEINEMQLRFAMEKLNYGRSIL